MTRRHTTMTIGAAFVLAAGCGIAIKRDLSGTTPQAALYDDVCGLQDYFDTLAGGKVAPPKVVSATDLEKENSGRPGGGIATYAFETDFQLRHLRRVLGTNWKRLPEGLLQEPRLEIGVRWTEKASVRRVVTTEDATLTARRETYALPYHQCLSDLLFGAPLYETRRQLLGLPAIVPAMAATADGGAVDGGTDGAPGRRD